MISADRKAFTMVEIMIVVAIIGVMLAIALPSFIRAREVARARACKVNLMRINEAVGAFAGHTKKQRGEPVAFDDLIMPGGTGFLRAMPRCPSGGEYTVETIGEPATCSEDHSAWEPQT